jgi:hypothetical protein
MAVAYAHRGGAAAPARGHARRGTGRCQPRPTPAALLELHTLQALDATLAGASLRDVAEGLFGADAVAADWHSDGGLRARVRRLVRRGDALMRGGYRRLAQLPLEKGRFDGTQNVPEQAASFSETASIRLRCVAGLDGGSSHATRSLAACRRCLDCAAQPQRYLTNDEAADYLRLSPRTLEKQRVIGGGPRRKFGRRVMYAVADLDAWAAERSFETTSDPEYAEHHAADSRAR